MTPHTAAVAMILDTVHQVSSLLSPAGEEAAQAVTDASVSATGFPCEKDALTRKMNAA